MKKILLTCVISGTMLWNTAYAALPSLKAADGEIGGHEYVDLGLPSGLLWATCNLGATNPFETGDYYPWGDTMPSAQSDLAESDYKFFLDYDGVHWVVEYLGDDITATEYDAAAANWGNGWRMPTYAEVGELAEFLKDNSLYPQTWVDEDGTVGMAIGDRMFFPAKYEIEMESSLLPETIMTRLGEYASSTVAKYRDEQNILQLRNYVNCGMYFDLLTDLRRCTHARWIAQLIRPVYGEITPYQWSGDNGEPDTEWNGGHSNIARTVAEGAKVGVRVVDGSLVVTGAPEGASVAVYDLAGRRVMASALNGHTVDLPALTPGVYIATVAGKSVKIRL